MTTHKRGLSVIRTADVSRLSRVHNCSKCVCVVSARCVLMCHNSSQVSVSQVCVPVCHQVCISYLLFPGVCVCVMCHDRGCVNNNYIKHMCVFYYVIRYVDSLRLKVRPVSHLSLIVLCIYLWVWSWSKRHKVEPKQAHSSVRARWRRRRLHRRVAALGLPTRRCAALGRRPRRCASLGQCASLRGRTSLCRRRRRDCSRR